jgi:4-amino-4-deoxy-L-arabinose transferase-like glycosyltransferase
VTRDSTSTPKQVQAVEQPKAPRALWPFFAATTVAVIVIAAIRWSLAHPYGIYWDEAEYINEIQIDGQRLRTGHLIRLAGRILVHSQGRPPAYRLLAMPFVALFGYHTTEVRLISLACFVLSASFVYLAARRVSSSVAAGLAVLIFCLSPELISASTFFSTDTELYLGTAATLYFIFVYWSNGSASTRDWIGLGLAMGLGLLSKSSFFAILLPVTVFWFLASHWARLRVPGLRPQLKAFALALVIAGPWWVFGFKSAAAYAAYARGSIRNSAGSPSFTTWVRWLESVVACLLGHAVSILVTAILIACVVRLILKKRIILNRLQTAVVGACLFAGLPLVLAQLSGTNHSMRYLTPALIPFAITIGILADGSGWTHSRAALAFSAVLACAQLGMIVSPVIHPNTEPVGIGFVNGFLPWRALARYDQWDWQPIQSLADNCGVAAPAISYLGNERGFNPPQIEYPWVARATSTRATQLDIPSVTWLWRYDEGGPFDWPKIMDAADRSDMVITAPNFAGTLEDFGNLDNQYNAEFAQHLSQDPLFQGPFRFQMGRFQPIDVEVFVKKSLGCRTGNSR